MAVNAMLFLCNKVFVLTSLDNIITAISTYKYKDAEEEIIHANCQSKKAVS